MNRNIIKMLTTKTLATINGNRLNKITQIYIVALHYSSKETLLDTIID